MTFTPELARRQFSALSQHIDGKPAIFSTAPAAHRFHGACWKNDGLREIQRQLGGHYFSSRVTGEVMGGRENRCAPC